MWKRLNHGDSEKISGGQGVRGRRGGETDGRGQRTFRAVRRVPVVTRLSKPTEQATPSVSLVETVGSGFIDGLPGRGGMNLRDR